MKCVLRAVGSSAFTFSCELLLTQQTLATVCSLICFMLHPVLFNSGTIILKSAYHFS